jgi:hypothetical protein
MELQFHPGLNPGGSRGIAVYLNENQIRDSEVGIDSAVDWTVRGSNPGRGKRFLSFPKRPDWL